MPLVLFTYFNPVHAYGLARFAEHAAASGIDGVLCVDLPPEEAEGEYLDALARFGLDPIFLLAPTSTRERVEGGGARRAAASSTTSRAPGSPASAPSCRAASRARSPTLRHRLKLPVAVGFGISTPEQVAAVAKVADGVVVGSALVRLVADHGTEPDLPELLASIAGRMVAATQRRR